MSASPTTTAPSQKRPLEEPSSPSGPTDQPDAKRPALDKVVKGEDSSHEEKRSPKPAEVPAGETAGGVKLEPTSSSPIKFENGTKDGQGDTVVPDAPNGSAIPSSVTQEPQHIQTTTSVTDRAPHSSSHPPHQDESSWIHIRAVITSAEAATVIGKGGENVTQIRRLSGAKCTVSDYSRGAVERILTVSGMVDATAKVRVPSRASPIVLTRKE
jgi:heterogeneous nuclear rnp K-like protein